MSFSSCLAPFQAKSCDATEVVLKKLRKKVGKGEQIDTSLYLNESAIVSKILSAKMFFQYFGKNLTVRVYISGVGNWLVQKIAQSYNLEFGACHVGILINGTSIDWYDDSTVHLGDWGNSSSCFMMFKPATDTITFTPEIAEKIGEVIVKWNTTKYYSIAEASCQHFVIDFFQTVFNSHPFPQGLVGQRISDLIKGDTKKSITTQNGEVLTFNTHEELDAIEIRAQQDSTLLTAEASELLKVFHRGFQMAEKRPGAVHRDCPLGRFPTGVKTEPVALKN